MSEPTTKTAPRWGQERRLAFIDFRLLYYRRVNRSDLTDFFGISPNQATQDLGRYSELAGPNLAYDLRERSFIPSGTFEPAYTPNDASAYLNELLAIETDIKDEASSFIGWRPQVGVVPTPARPVGAELLAQLLNATRARAAVDITYQSMSRNEPTARTISPHAFGFDGHRWHVRAWCFLRAEFCDFVLGRILSVEVNGTGGMCGQEDRLWHLVVPLHVAPNPHLSPAKQAAIALDYGMEDGKVTVRSRQPLLWYALKRLGLLEVASEDDANQYLVLLNRPEVEQALALRSDGSVAPTAGR
jgi:hypothetical protein